MCCAGILQHIFTLCCFQLPGLEHLCPVKRYWQACLAVTLLGTFNTATLGTALWQGHPTVRCMLQMLLTGVFKHMPLGGVSPDDIVRSTLAIAVVLDLVVCACVCSRTCVRASERANVSSTFKNC